MTGRDRRGRRSGISDARAYSPRGRTTREQAEPEPRRARVRPERGAPRRAAPRPQPAAKRQPVRRKRAASPALPRLISWCRNQVVRAQPPRLGSPGRRLRLATALVLVLFSVIGIRLVQLQVTVAPAYAAAGLKERLDKIVLAAPRGTIYDRNGAVLAHSVEARYVAADPELVEDIDATAAQLAPLLGKAPSELRPLLQRRARELSGDPVRFTWLARGVDVSIGDQILALQLPGIRVERDERRDVPGRDLAANLIGFTGTDHDGLAGIEAKFDDLLAGRNGELVVEVGQGQLRMPVPGGYRLETPAHPGSSLRLTIDRDVQFEVQRILHERLAARNASYGAAVVLDVRTGEVVAQASYPTYDAANPFGTDPKYRGDVATSTMVDPGSIHKAIVLAGALEEGVVGPDSTVEVAPAIRKGGESFSDTRPFPAGTQLTLPGLMAYSSNVGTITVADMLGAEKLYQYQRKFGLGDPTGIGVPGELAGLVQPPSNWSGSSYGSVPIGHSVAVTPIQMAAVYAAIANDGLWVQPHLVQETITTDGRVMPAEPPTTRQVISPENAAALREIMEAVTTIPDATGVKAALPGYRVSGKTGTGLEVRDGRYVSGEVASFVGMAPADQPRFVIAVFAHTPGGGGGQIAGPAFREMMAYTMLHFKVPPTGTSPPDYVVTR